MAQLSSMEKILLSSLSFTTNFFPSLTCIWIISASEGDSFIMDITYLDLRYKYLVIGIGDDASQEDSVKASLSGGTVPVLTAYRAATIWIRLDGNTGGSYRNGGFELEVFTLNTTGK